ncbi:MAG: hypothetical protein JWO11_1029 [Nocardioides sp.]|nr:hypothetical protein [Nocardioides sp.]
MTGPRRQWRHAGAAFGLVALATAVLAGTELARNDPPSAGSAATPSAPTASVPSSTPPATEPGPAPAFRCWNGSEAAALADCPEPTGAAGLAWVFPSLDLDRCTDLLATESAPQLRQLYECRVPLDGRHVSIAYAEWRSSADAIDYYDAQSARRVSIRGAAGRPLRFGWLYDTGAGEVSGALAYTDAPFSVLVRAPDAATRSAAGHDVIRLRPTSELRGVPLGR